MGWLTRKAGRTPSSEHDRIGRFWQWWSDEGAAATAAAIDRGEPATLTEAISARVSDIDPGLAWELGPGAAGSRHVLVVSPEGDPALRPVARRWRRAAPAADPTWCYADARLRSAQPGRGTFEIGDVRADLGEARVSATVEGPAVDVVVHHPAFARIDDQAMQTLAFLILDDTLGEDAVEIWVGRIDTSRQPLVGGVELASLRALVDDLAARHPVAGPDRLWALARAEGPGGPVLARFQQPLRPAARPELDTLVQLTIRVPEGSQRGGFPDPATADRLDAFEEHLEGLLGDSGQLVAVETSPGRRVLHFYADGSTPAEDQLRAGLGEWAGSCTLRSAADPAWDAVRHLR